jgi:hypothetical protein
MAIIQGELQDQPDTVLWSDIINNATSAAATIAQMMESLNPPEQDSEWYSNLQLSPGFNFGGG